MLACPFCTFPNPENASACSNCGRELNPGSRRQRPVLMGMKLGALALQRALVAHRSPLIPAAPLIIVSLLVLFNVILLSFLRPPPGHSPSPLATPSPRSIVNPSPTPSPTSLSMPSPTPPPTPTFTPTPTEIAPSPTPTLSLTVSPTSINANATTDCNYSPKDGWGCSVTLSSAASNQGSLTWSVSSSDLSASYSQPTGTLPSNSSQKIEIFVSSQTVCPTTGTFTFTGGASPATVSWSCVAPTLTVSPTSLGTGNCQSGQNGDWVCSVTLSDDEGGAQWMASSDIGASFSPSSDTVYPGGETITITVGCVSGTFSFQGPANTATVSWQCIA